MAEPTNSEKLPDNVAECPEFRKKISACNSEISDLSLSENWYGLQGKRLTIGDQFSGRKQKVIERLQARSERRQQLLAEMNKVQTELKRVVTELNEVEHNEGLLKDFLIRLKEQSGNYLNSKTARLLSL